MIAKPRFSLATKVVLLTLVNLALVFLILALFVRFQLREEFGSFLLATARERILAVSRLLALELAEIAPAQWDELLARYAATHKITFVLCDHEGNVLAGPRLELPQAVVERLRRPPGLPRGGPERGPGRPPPPDRFSHWPPPFQVETEGPLGFWVGVRIPTRDPHTGAIARSTLLLASSSFFANPFFFQLEPWLVIVAVAVVVSLLCWLPLIRGLTRSIRQMVQATSRIAEGQFDIQVDSRRKDELGSLGASINRMSSRLESFVRGQKRFLGDVAHELRSPLGRMQVALGIIERRAGPELHSYIEDLQEEVQTMSELTDELLTLAKAEMTAETVKLEPVVLAEAVQEAVRMEGKGTLDVRIDVDPGLRALAVRDYLVRSIANLVRNAARYAGEAGPVTISAARDGGHVVLTVADCGPGVPEDALEKIFTPFYRLEASRDRRTGGVGLGLAIVRSCIEACRGAVNCRNRLPSGLEVNLRLPAA